MGKYIVVVESDKPPQIFIHDDVPNIGKVLEIKAEEIPNRVTAAWLMDRYSLSRKLIIDELRPFNKGTNGKHLYDPNEVIPILENLNRQRQQRQSRRKN
ncbi:hypothetical protein KWD61_17145 [Acinetobacter baumannii]|uniref:hypothetical protein n=1 Tax=Acinetobacter baumannii TaxID=470 RepID=UPI000B9E6AA9|nr:hypothetical protein [Acinetobacter baumannii]EHU1297196.1 hypothetical protein [Acinetobacter baumannii]OZI89612.1 hypothetical protein CFN62_12370 [Acinetobacter baumannii]TPS26139.1 hypothetical protein FJV08_12510 [Acinetobacter baumannii]